MQKGFIVLAVILVVVLFSFYKYQSVTGGSLESRHADAGTNKQEDQGTALTVSPGEKQAVFKDLGLY